MGSPPCHLAEKTGAKSEIIDASSSHKHHKDCNFSKTLYTHFLNEHHAISLQNYITREMCYWLGAEAAYAMAKKIPNIGAILHGRVPPCVMHAVFSCWCNAWGTNERFQVHDKTCIMSHSCNGGDGIKHYANCEAVWQWTVRTFRIRHLQRGLKTFLLVGIDGEHDVISLALNLYAVYSTMNKWHHKNTPCPTSQLHSHLHDGVRTACNYSTKL